ncbi:N-acetylglucosaminyltransferase [Lambiella insularis]|nr:N-acetylglucosaminyltransferase [Lambiella insularis]
MKKAAGIHGRWGASTDIPMLHDLYDSDDDTPLDSPKTSVFHSLQTSPRSLYWRLRRSRSLVLVILAVIAIFYYSSKYHRRLFAPTHKPSLRYKGVDWRLFAYSQYATDTDHLCNSVMVFEALDRLGSKPDRILMYPEEWDSKNSTATDRDRELLMKARNWYRAKLLPVEVKRFERETNNTAAQGGSKWDTSITKFLTFNQTNYLRIIHFDSDVTVQQHMDGLFMIPSARVAVTRAYWRLPAIKAFSSRFLLIEPSTAETSRLIAAAESTRLPRNELAMDVVNSVFEDSAMVLPHQQYGLISEEFRVGDHRRFSGNDYEKWNPKRVLREASLVHFSDWPLPKPWVMWPRNLLQEKIPLCEINPGTDNEAGCESRDIWMALYGDFRKRRKDICALLSVPAPEWPPAPSVVSSDRVPSGHQ